MVKMKSKIQKHIPGSTGIRKDNPRSQMKQLVGIILNTQNTRILARIIFKFQYIDPGFSNPYHSGLNK